LVRRPLFGLLYQPRMIGAVDGMTVDRRNLPQFYVVQHKPTWPGLRLNLYRRSGKPATNLIGLLRGGVQLGPLGTAVTNRPNLPTPGDSDDGEIGGMIIGR
jgi:hypothetical protein